jgi:type I restriction enzyme R subunit
MLGAERREYGEVVLGTRLRDAPSRLNPALPAPALEDSFRKLTRPEGADLIERNRATHRLLVNGAARGTREPIRGSVRPA